MTSTDIGPVANPNAECPCGSGKMAPSCHLRQDGTGLAPLLPANTAPPGPRTGFGHPKCYARTLGDCSKQLSKEHFFSRSISKQLGSNVVVGGFSWQSVPEQKLQPDQLVAKVLCRRHNEALSALDTAASKLFERLRNAHEDPDCDALFYFSGDDFEKWALKLLCGSYASGATVADSARNLQVPDEWVEALFSKDVLMKPLGLYFAPNDGLNLHVGSYFSAQLHRRLDRKLGGCYFNFGGYRFYLCMDPTAEAVTTTTGLHPWRILFEGPRASQAIEFSWLNGHSGMTICPRETHGPPLERPPEITQVVEALARRFASKAPTSESGKESGGSNGGPTAGSC